MKLTDILYEVDTLENLVESFTYVPKDLEWSGDVGRFSVNGERFGATVIPADPDAERTYSLFFNPVPKVGDVDFWMELDRGKTQDATGLMRASAFKVFASVIAVIGELMERRGYDVLLCAAKRQNSPTHFESRVRAYETIVLRVSQRFKLNHIKVVESPDSVVWAVFDSDLYDGMVKVADHIKSHLGQD
jgi:hypothetical protein